MSGARPPTRGRGRSSTSSSGRGSPRSSKRRDHTTAIFAFGSNLDVLRMQRRCGSVEIDGIAILPKHRIAFGGHSERWGGAVATVLPDDRAHVPGVIYRLSDASLDALDQCEGYPFVYDRVPLAVFAHDKRWRTADTYVLRHFTVGRPAPHYFDTIRWSYRAWGFDALTSFVQTLKEAQ